MTMSNSDYNLRFLSQGGVNITDEKRSFDAFYETYGTEPEADGDLPDRLASGGHISSESRFFGVIDIIITGEVRPFAIYHIHISHQR
jgi:hypothetical protein